MFRKIVWALLLVLLVPLDSRAQAKADPDVTKGIALVDEGDYDGAILTLDNAARRLSADKTKARDLSQAYLYLAIAYMGKGHEAAARAKFREAFGQIKDLSLSPDKFPPKVIDAFEAAKEEARKDAAGKATATGPGATGSAGTTAGSSGAPEKKKGGSKGLLIAGGVAVVGAGVAVAAGGGGGSTPTAATTPPDPRKTETFTGTFCLRPGCEDYGRDYDIVVSSPGRLEASITWTNAAVFFAIELMDENYQTIARSNRITNMNSQVAADVSPRTSSPSAAYKLYVNVNNAVAAESYTLTVKHP